MGLSTQRSASPDHGESYINTDISHRVLRHLASVVALCAALSGCGGGGSAADASATTSSQSNPSNVSSLKVGQVSTWSRQIVDNYAHTINLSYSNTITAVNADGGYEVTRTTVGGAIPVVNGTDYTANSVEEHDASGAVSTITDKERSPVDRCAFSGSPQPVVFPLTLGLTWSKQWTKSCSNGLNATFVVSNTRFVGQESLTVAAGAFTANHAQFTITETVAGPNPVVITSDYDCWYEILSNHELKCRWTNNRTGGTSTSGYAASVTEEIQSSSFTIAARTPPVVGSSSVIKQTILDNSNNTINLTVTSAVTKVNVDGSSAYSSTTNGGSVAKVNGTDYTVNSDSSYAANGALLSTTFKTSNTVCSYAPAPQPVVWPLSVGLTWEKQWTESCQNGFSASLSLSNGQVLDVEPIVVAAGSFNAYKVQYQITSTPAGINPLITSTKHTCWIDVLSRKTLKCSSSSSRSGGSPSTNGYAVSIDTELQSSN